MGSMIDSFYEENTPPPWAVQLARARFREAGEPDPGDWPVRKRAWEIVQAMERDITARPP